MVRVMRQRPVAEDELPGYNVEAGLAMDGAGSAGAPHKIGNETSVRL